MNKVVLLAMMRQGVVIIEIQLYASIKQCTNHERMDKGSFHVKSAHTKKMTPPDLHKIWSGLGTHGITQSHKILYSGICGIEFA